MIGFIGVNGNHVKPANLLSPVRVFSEKPVGRARNPGLLVDCNCISTGAMLVICPEFYLDKNDGVFVFHDQINFTKAAIEVPV